MANTSTSSLSDEEHLLRERDALIEENKKLLEQVAEKRLLLISKPTFRADYFVRKVAHVVVYALRSLKVVPPAKGKTFPEKNSELSREIRRLTRKRTLLWVRCLRLEALIVENPIFSTERLLVHLQNWYDFLPERLYRLFFKHYRHRLGLLVQHEPRAIRRGGMPPRIVDTANLPSIQIVIPSYQQGRYLERTIQSVIQEKYPNLRLRIQDGGSLDETVDVIRRYESHLSGWVSQRDNGQTEAIQSGFVHVEGEIMSYLNSDDLLLPGTLNFVGNYFKLHPEVDVVYGNRVVINEEDEEIGRWILPAHDTEVLKWADYIPQETMFWRRRLYEKVGGMDTSFRFAMDWDLLIRFQEAEARIVHLPYFMGAFRVHKSQKTSGIIESIGKQEMELIRERIHRRKIHDVMVARMTRKYLIQSALLSRWWYLKQLFSIN